jgi:hypothetical protein
LRVDRARRPARLEVRHLLEPICREGRLPGMGTESDYRALLGAAGLQVTGVEDLSDRVKDTWPRCARALGARLLRKKRYRTFRGVRAQRRIARELDWVRSGPMRRKEHLAGHKLLMLLSSLFCFAHSRRIRAKRCIR